MRSTFKHGSSQPAGVVSDIFAYGLAPATCISLAIAVPMHDGRGNEAPENILLIVEASLAFAVMQEGLTDRRRGGNRAALGIGTGIAIPLLLHRRVAADSSERPTAATRWLRGAMVSTTEVPGGRIVGIGWGF